MLLILSTLSIVHLSDMIMEVNTIRATIITIATITTTTAINHGEKSIIFMARKFVALINIQTMSNKK